MIHFYPHPVALAWTAICLVGWVVSVLSLLQLWFKVRPSLIRRGAWEHLGVRKVVYQYLRRDFTRSLRSTAFVLIGVTTLFTQAPVLADVRVTVTIIAIVLIGGRVTEALDALLDFQYRQSWWRPGSRALRYPMMTDIPGTETDG